MLLTKFAVKNYRGFANRIEWDLSSPSSYEFNTGAIKDGIIKNGIVYGANGCGKTNLSLALFDIVYHLTQKFKIQDYYNNFVYAGAVDRLVDFEYTFCLNNQIVFYKYSKTRNGMLVNESLVANNELVFNKENKSFFINAAFFQMDTAVQENIANSFNGMSVVNYLLSAYPISADHYLALLKRFVEGMLWFRNVDVRQFIGLDTGITVLDEYIIKKRLHNDFKDFLRTVSGQTFEIMEPDKSDKVLYCKYGKNKIPFDEIASTGTHGLLLLYVWLQKISEATFVFVDEFDAFYHYALSFEICQRLFSLNCQVFVSSHNTYLMTNYLLRPDCNFILSNNEIKPLCNCTPKELRWANNIEKLYRGGTFKV